MRLPEIFGLSLKQVRYTYPGFECPKFLRNLLKLRYQPEKVKNIENIPEFLKIEDIHDVLYDLANYIHSKNAFKTVSGAEINGFLCFGHFWSNLDSI